MILAIDPGTHLSAYSVIAGGRIAAHGKMPNEAMIELIGGQAFELVVCEMIASYGMSVGAEIFETAVWIGEYRRICKDRKIPWHTLTRVEVKKRLCHHTSGVNDAVIRQRLIDMYGGKEKAIGNKKAPGPLYGIKADVWAALAVAKAFELQEIP